MTVARLAQALGTTSELLKNRKAVLWPDPSVNSVL
jgi:hypothetical protein